MAHKKGVGSTDNGRDSNSKRLGVKIFGGQLAKAGNIIVRQRGTKFHAGENVYLGKDFTLHAAVEGRVAFRKRKNNRTFVSIIPLVEEAVEVATANIETVTSTSEVTNESAEIASAAAVESVEEVSAEVESVVEEAATPVVTEEPAPVVMSAAAPEVETTEEEVVDDLTKIEGIGPKLASLLNEAGIKTFAKLAATPASDVKDILNEAGSRYKIHDPTTWGKQAQMAVDGKWEELKEYQDYLDGGKDPANK